MFINPASRFAYLGPTESSFTEVSGIKATAETEEYSEMGNFGQPLQTITGRKFDNLVLKRGFFYSSKIVRWVEYCLAAKETQHTTVMVHLLDTGNKMTRSTPLISWMFLEAHPVSIEYSGFNSMNNEYVVETLELHYNYFKILDTGLAGSVLSSLPGF